MFMYNYPWSPYYDTMMKQKNEAADKQFDRNSQSLHRPPPY